MGSNKYIWPVYKSQGRPTGTIDQVLTAYISRVPYENAQLKDHSTYGLHHSSIHILYICGQMCSAKL